MLLGHGGVALIKRVVSLQVFTVAGIGAVGTWWSDLNREGGLITGWSD